MRGPQALAATIGCAALAVAGLAGAATAGATPVFVKAARAADGGVYIVVRVRPQGGTRCKVNLFARVYVEAPPIRVVGGHGRQTVDACFRTMWSGTVPARLPPRVDYVVCVRATNNNDAGQTIAHTSCRRFRG